MLFGSYADVKSLVFSQSEKFSHRVRRAPLPLEQRRAVLKGIQADLLLPFDYAESNSASLKV